MGFSIGFRHGWSLLGTIGLALSITGDAQDLQSPIANTDKAIVTIAKNELVRPLPLPRLKDLTLVEAAYLDSYSILKEDNTCSQFFGGQVAIEALNRLASQLKPSYLDRLIGIRMRGHTTNVIDAGTGFTYRVFDTAEVNLNGPFFSGPSMPFQLRILPVGVFRPNTREARAALLLHELGHMIPNPNGGWRLPDDGNDYGQSEENTRNVIQVCRKQLDAIHKLSIGAELLEVRPEVTRGSMAAEGSGR